jgi:hypothetical protein
MKKALLYFLLNIIFIGSVKSQEYYAFDVELNSTYQHIKPDTIYTKPNFGELTDISFLQPPFVPKSFFQINGFEANFGVGLKRLILPEVENREGNELHITPFGLDFKRQIIGRTDDSLSHLSMAVDTINQERLMTFQWRNVTYDGSEDLDSLNFQLKVFENGIIEMHYGSAYITNTDSAFGEGRTGPDVSFYSTVNCGKPEQCYKVTYRLVGGYKSPSINEFPVNPGYMDTIPPSGTVYRFTPQIFYTDVNDKFLRVRLETYPNPAAEKIYFHNKHLTYPLNVTITNIAGQRQTLVLNQGENEISLAQKGVLIIELQDAAGRKYSQKVVSK